MKSDASLFSSLGVSAAAGATSTATSARSSGSESAGKDEFAQLMRKTETQVAREPQAATTDTLRREADTKRPQTADETASEATTAPTSPSTDAATQATATNTNDRAPVKDAAEDDSMDTDALLAGLMLPGLLMDPNASAPTANGGFAAGDALLGGARASVLPAALRFSAMATMATTGTPASSIPLPPRPESLINDAASTPLAATARGAAPVASTPGSAASAPATTALAQAPADGALVLPAGLSLFKDTLDTLAPGKRDELPAAGAAFALAGSPAPSDNGLARTATVNPLTSLTPDVGTDPFGETLGTQLTYMAHEKIGHAHIKISPQDLGSIEVSLKLDGDQVRADFSSPQPEVRQALEQSLPRLRDMLGQHGFQLTHADVGHRQQSQTPASESGYGGRGGSDGRTSAEAEGAQSAPVVRVVRGLLDAYA